MLERDAMLERLDGSLAAIAALRDRLDDVAALAEAAVGCLAGGGLLATAGNGGSAAQALHLAEELVGRYRADRRPLRATCLSADPTALTCIANDYGFDEVFARPCAALLGPGDALVVLSTSGRSPNVVKALAAARDRGARTLGLLGRDGGDALAACDVALVVPAADSALVQDAHQVALHLVCEAVERWATAPAA